ncbi:MAG TPA: ABC transporter permease [Clostridiales bacterium]|nr:ABC transporter permease [Clostridiales bacterium]
MSMYNGLSKERVEYLRQNKKRKTVITITRIVGLICVIALWEVLARLKIIDSFIMSQPSRIVDTFINMMSSGLMKHIGVTCLETLIGFLLGTAMGTLVAVLLWWSNFMSRVMEPLLVILNSLPKIALGPVIIIWVGAGMQAIIVVAIAISLIVTILEMLNGFISTDGEKIKMVKTFGANKLVVFTKIVFPSNIGTLFNSLKINIGLSLVGVIAGEFLVSKAGLGYLIVYGGQVFQMDLVMCSVIILAAVAALMYQGVVLLEKFSNRILKFSSK